METVLPFPVDKIFPMKVGILLQSSNDTFQAQAQERTKTSTSFRASMSKSTDPGTVSPGKDSLSQESTEIRKPRKARSLRKIEKNQEVVVFTHPEEEFLVF